MATFKVGQRVKKVEDVHPLDVRGPRASVYVPNGAVGTVTATSADFGDYLVRYDRYPSSHSSGTFAALSYQLAPLTDPRAEQFIESLKKLGREPQFTPEKAT